MTAPKHVLDAVNAEVAAVVQGGIYLTRDKRPIFLRDDEQGRMLLPVLKTQEQVSDALAVICPIGGMPDGHAVITDGAAWLKTMDRQHDGRPVDAVVDFARLPGGRTQYKAIRLL